MVKELHSIRLQRHYSPPSLKGVKNIGIDEFAVNIFVRTVIRSRSIPFTIAAEPEESIRKKAIEAIRDIRREAMSRPGPEITLEEINAEINAVREAKE